MVGSANPETMEQFLDDDDLVIMGNRYDAQVCALECNASCLIIAGSPQVPKSIIKMAAERNCVVITTDYDTYTAARLVNQSMPIKFFMRRDQLVTFELEEYIDAGFSYSSAVGTDYTSKGNRFCIGVYRFLSDALS